MPSVWKSWVRFFFNKEPPTDSPGGLILFEGHPNYFIKALNEVLFLGAALPRPSHPRDPKGPEAEVTPRPGQRGSGQLTARIGLKRTQSFH